MSSIEAKYIASEIEQFLKRYGIHPELIGQISQILHVILFISFFYLIINVKSRKSLIALLLMIILIAITQFYFKGCIITAIERRLSRTRSTLIDKLFDLQADIYNFFGIHMKKNDATHMRFTITWVAAAMILLLWRLFCN